ncbi:MAG: hypothetical protein HYV27_15585 [Candidatus Hydrogenedentes bacterium]|nr:hypothetical protein [Candidatus Hydrogenedentota bacterium]
MKYVLHFPLFALALIAYNAIMITGDAFRTNPDVISIPLMANDDVMPLKLGDIFVMLGVILLYFEILKATRASRSTIVDHALSMLVFVAFLIEYIVVAGAGTATFMILTLMALLEVIAGFTITISTSRRDVSFGGN